MFQRVNVATGWGVVVAGPMDSDGPALHPDEIAFVHKFPAHREREWSAGRRVLREALAHAGLSCDAPILVGPGGAPSLPEHVTASVTHKGEQVAAACAPLAPADGWRLGIDLEQRAAGRTDIARRVLTEAERADESVDIMLRFSAKEAVYKAMHPLVARTVGFMEVAVWAGDQEGRVRFDPLPTGIAAEARFVHQDDLLLVVARARRV